MSTSNQPNNRQVQLNKGQIIHCYIDTEGRELKEQRDESNKGRYFLVLSHTEYNRKSNCVCAMPLSTSNNFAHVFGASYSISPDDYSNNQLNTAIERQNTTHFTPEPGSQILCDRPIRISKDSKPKRTNCTIREETIDAIVEKLSQFLRKRTL